MVLTFQLLFNCLFFLSCFLSFIFSFSVSIVFFGLIFRFSPQSHPLFPPPISAPDKRERLFVCFRPFVPLFRVLGLRKKYGLFCGLKDFDVLVSWKL